MPEEFIFNYINSPLETIQSHSGAPENVNNLKCLGLLKRYHLNYLIQHQNKTPCDLHQFPLQIKQNLLQLDRVKHTVPNFLVRYDSLFTVAFLFRNEPGEIRSRFF